MSDTSSNTANTSAGSAQRKPALSMADLMASYKTSFHTFKKGDSVKGKITKLTKNEILVDINAKTDAVVLEKDRTMLHSLLDTLHVGDEVEVSILNPESDMGHSVVSLRRYMSNAAWKYIETAEKEEKLIDVTVTDVTKGGFVVVAASGLSGFLPNSHVNPGEHFTAGMKIQVRVQEIDRKENKIIFTQKRTMTLQAFEEALRQFKNGDVVEVVVANTAPFGIFVTIPVEGKTTGDGEQLVLDGLIHISEISWEKVEDVTQVYEAGEKIQAKIIGFDKDARRIDLSVKQLTEDPFEAILAKYPVDMKVKGTVTKVDDTGVTVSLEGVEGLIRKDKVPPTVTYAEGQTVSATVSEIDRRRHKLYLVPVLLEKPIGYR